MIFIVRKSFSMKSNILNVMLLMPFRNVIIISMSKFSMSKNLEQLQADGCQTDICLVGATSKVFIHRVMLFAGHVEPDPVLFGISWIQGRRMGRWHVGCDSSRCIY